ncbi:FliC/FljB family flagellin [Proteus vulgaris]|uniref:FliC/FljB family flagellin n=1 Tax=Proteus vulgaris TaxID=585 RepID=UPI001FFF5CA1|nr:FliC/FljB family flagellin [Proteus vulgaris]UPK79691.1 FliC/FljB family flagellin [Proteus vulgaris]
MAQVINTNYLSLVTQNNLNKSQGALGSAIERLSSGMRINSAKDDAAGQAIANRFTSNVNGLTQASRNANDGISLAQTAEGALNEINNNLQRIRELTVQAKNGTNSTSDVKSIQEEVDERLNEIQRISDQTQFNGVKVLSEDTDMKIHVGTNDGEAINVSLKKIDKTELGVNDFKVFTEKEGVAITGGAAQDVEALGGTAAKKIQDTADDAEVTVAKRKEGTKEFDDKFIATKGGDKFEVTSKSIDADGNVKLVLGKKIEDDAKTASKVEVNETSLATLDDAINKVDATRSNLGAIQNRFESTINNLNNTVNNLSAARSRILDADYATEVSNMSRGQILQQAGTSVLAQANQVPQSVLSLLR